jgi:hypothetical protein
MESQSIAARPIRRPQPAANPETSHRGGVRLPAGADARIFGGWGVRF